MSNPHRPNKTDRTRIQRAIRAELKSKKTRTSATKAAMDYVARRVGAAK